MKDKQYELKGILNDYQIAYRLLEISSETSKKKKDWGNGEINFMFVSSKWPKGNNLKLLKQRKKKVGNK